MQMRRCVLSGSSWAALVSIISSLGNYQNRSILARHNFYLARRGADRRDATRHSGIECIGDAYSVWIFDIARARARARERERERERHALNCSSRPSSFSRKSRIMTDRKTRGG
jgi:hypothetical protein